MFWVQLVASNSLKINPLTLLATKIGSLAFGNIWFVGDDACYSYRYSWPFLFAFTSDGITWHFRHDSFLTETTHFVKVFYLKTSNLKPTFITERPQKNFVLFSSKQNIHWRQSFFKQVGSLALQHLKGTKLANLLSVAM